MTCFNCDSKEEKPCEFFSLFIYKTLPKYICMDFRIETPELYLTHPKSFVINNEIHEFKSIKVLDADIEILKKKYVKAKIIFNNGYLLL